MIIRLLTFFTPSFGLLPALGVLAVLLVTTASRYVMLANCWS